MRTYDYTLSQLKVTCGLFITENCIRLDKYMERNIVSLCNVSWYEDLKISLLQLHVIHVSCFACSILTYSCSCFNCFGFFKQ